MWQPFCAGAVTSHSCATTKANRYTLDGSETVFPGKFFCLGIAAKMTRGVSRVMQVRRDNWSEESYKNKFDRRCISSHVLGCCSELGPHTHTKEPVACCTARSRRCAVLAATRGQSAVRVGLHPMDTVHKQKMKHKIRSSKRLRAST